MGGPAGAGGDEDADGGGAGPSAGDGGVGEAGWPGVNLKQLYRDMARARRQQALGKNVVDDAFEVPKCALQVGWLVVSQSELGLECCDAAAQVFFMMCSAPTSSCKACCLQPLAARLIPCTGAAG